MTSGTSRSIGFVKELRKRGYQPIVLTVSKSKDPWVEHGNRNITDVPQVRTLEWNLAGIVDFFHGVFSKFFGVLGIDLKRNYFREIFCIPDSQIAWLSTLKGIKLANDCDYIYASCSPFSSAISACLIKYFTNKPLILDFRDAWTLNPYIHPTAPHRFIIKHLESWVLRNCDSLIVNTPGAERLYSELYPAYAFKVTAIPNGYDELNLAEKYNSDDTFSIMHVGELHGQRQPNHMLEALAAIDNEHIEFVQIGPKFSSYDLYKDKVQIKLLAYVEREEALKIMKSASLLYLNQGRREGVKDYIAVGAKTYEYLSTGLPILADCPEGDNAELVREFGRNSFTVTSGEIEDLREAIEKAYDNRNRIKPEVDLIYIQNYSRAALTKRLVQILEKI